MNTLIKGARFSPRTARQHRLRVERQRGRETGVLHPQDNWSQAADALTQNDPDGRKLAALLAEKVTS